MMYWDHGWSGADWVVVGVLMLLFWAVVVAAGIALVRSLGQPGRGQGLPDATGSGAERILAERYARGEIDEDEYTRRRDVLRSR